MLRPDAGFPDLSGTVLQKDSDPSDLEDILDSEEILGSLVAISRRGQSFLKT